MKYYYLNRIAMAVLVALLLFFGTRTLINIAFEEHPPEKPGFEVAGTDEKPEGGTAKPDAAAEFIAALHKANVAQGETDAALCKVCHTFDKGGATLIGPNLYGIAGKKIASHEGVTYTPALKAKEGDWTFENLDHWLTNPQAFAPGTTMAFPGIPDIQKRANVVAYINKNSDNPLPLPEAPAAEAPPTEEAGADAGEKPAGEAGGQPEILTLMASADPAKGAESAALCKVCHTVDKGGATLIGPNLYNVVGANVAAHEDFTYTPALKGKGGKWDYVTLDAWLTNPQAFAPGTTMAFPGIPDAKTRADVIAYLRTLSDNPVPLPEAAAGKPAEEAPATAEEPAPADEPAAEEPAAEEPAAAEEPDAEESAAEEPAPTEEPAAEEPAPVDEPAAEESVPAEEPAAEEPAETPEAATEETIVNPPTVSEDAPSEPHMGEPASESQPQPVYPDGEPGAAPAEEPAADETTGDATDETIAAPPTVSDDAPPEPNIGEPPSDSQPQPVYPDGEPDDSADDKDSTGSIEAGEDDTLSSQPQPVYPDGAPEGL